MMAGAGGNYSARKSGKPQVGCHCLNDLTLGQPQTETELTGTGLILYKVASSIYTSYSRASLEHVFKAMRNPLGNVLEPASGCISSHAK